MAIHGRSTDWRICSRRIAQAMAPAIRPRFGAAADRNGFATPTPIWTIAWPRARCLAACVAGRPEGRLRGRAASGFRQGAGSADAGQHRMPDGLARQLRLLTVAEDFARSGSNRNRKRKRLYAEEMREGDRMQRRVPGDAGPRAAQSAGAHSQCPEHPPLAPRRCRHAGAAARR